MAHKPQQRPPVTSPTEQLKQREAEIAKQKADERRKTNYTVDPYRYGY